VENGVGSAIQSEHVGDLVTMGANSSAAASQSVGGGGGSGVIDLTLSEDSQVALDLTVGGTDSTSSGGGDIELRRVGEVLTTADVSLGTVVQSIGGGGGSLIVDITRVDEAESATAGVQPAVAAFGLPAARPALSAQAEGLEATAGSSANVVLGSNGSAGNDAGTVTLSFEGSTETNGALSPGMLVQSIGAGGGIVQLSGVDQLDVTFGGAGGASGDGGDITLNHLGDIFTGGALSHGMVLQSIGGGGGLVLADADDAAIGWSTSADNAGSGGDISLNQQGDVAALGDGAVALLVQSLGGGGGSVNQVFMGSAGGAGAAGDITIDLDGSLIASGAKGLGVFAQSVGSDGQGDIRLTLGRGHVIYGGADGVAVWLSGGAQNQLTNHGIVMTEDGALGTGVLADDGSTRIDNFGALLGVVDLADGSNTLTNHADATFAPGGLVDLGDTGSLLTNDGALRPGDTGRAQSVALAGSFVQSASGITHAELDFASDGVDQVLATGTVDLAGDADVALLNVGVIPVGAFSKTLFHGDQGVVDQGMVLHTAPSVVVEYDLQYTDNDAVLAYEVDFAPERMGDNLTAVGHYINRVQMAGGGSADYGDVVTKLVYDPDLLSYRNSLSQLSPDFYGEHQVQLVNSSIDFAGRLMSCRQAGGEYRFTREGSCIWLQYDSYDTRTDGHGDYKKMAGSTNRVSAGLQNTLANDWSIGFAVSREDNRSDGYGGRWSSEGDVRHVGLSAKRRRGASKWSAALTYASAEADTFRAGALLDQFATETSRDMEAASGMLRFSRDFEYDRWYVRPRIDGGFTWLNLAGAQEYGAGAAGLALTDHDETHLWLRPGLRVGREFRLGATRSVRLYWDAAVQTYLDGAATNVRARLIGAPRDVEPMSVAMDLGDPRLTGTFGVEFVSRTVIADFHLSSSRYTHTDTDAATLKLEFPLR
jgi:hypothetical protein